MKSTFASRLALSFAVLFPAAALPACADVPQASAYAAPGTRGADSADCSSARKTAELVRQMQMPDGGVPFAISAACERGTEAKKIRDHSPG